MSQADVQRVGGGRVIDSRQHAGVRFPHGYDTDLEWTWLRR